MVMSQMKKTPGLIYAEIKGRVNKGKRIWANDDGLEGERQCRNSEIKGITASPLNFLDGSFTGKIQRPITLLSCKGENPLSK